MFIHSHFCVFFYLHMFSYKYNFVYIFIPSIFQSPFFFHLYKSIYLRSVLSVFVHFICCFVLILFIVDAIVEEIRFILFRFLETFRFVYNILYEKKVEKLHVWPHRHISIYTFNNLVVFILMVFEGAFQRGVKDKDIFHS